MSALKHGFVWHMQMEETRVWSWAEWRWMDNPEVEAMLMMGCLPDEFYLQQAFPCTDLSRFFRRVFNQEQTVIHIEMTVKYPGLNRNEEERLRDAIRSVINHTVVSAACRVVKDAVPPNEEGDFLRSMHLDVDGTIKIVETPSTRKY